MKRGEGREQRLVGGLGGSLGRWVKALQRSWFELMEPLSDRAMMAYGSAYTDASLSTHRKRVGMVDKV